MESSENTEKPFKSSSAQKKKKMTRKQKTKKLRQLLRALIQLLYFIFIPSVYSAAFSGIKYIFTQIGNGELVEFTSFVTILIVVCLYTVIFGRFFCGYACAFGSFGDAVRFAYVWICRKLKKKPFSLPKGLLAVLTWIKYAALAAIVVLCFTGAYGSLRGSSPWDVFSMIHAFNFSLGNYTAGVIILLLLIVGMCVQERFFCRFLCPMGAVFSILPVLPFFTLRRDRKNCIKGCSACTRVCPADIELSSARSFETSGECFQCQKCTGTCPKENIHTGLPKLRGDEFWFTAIRALLLLFILIWAGI